MTSIFICYPTCTTCQKARAWLTANSISFEDRNIKDYRPSEKELTDWISQSGLSVRRFFNTSGLLYREMGLSDKLISMSDDEKIALLATNGMLVKRPIFLFDSTVLVGFKQKEWEQALLQKP